MRANVRKLRVKAKRLMKLYSQWHETHQAKIEKRYLSLLGEILAMEPHFSLRREFQRAF